MKILVIYLLPNGHVTIYGAPFAWLASAALFVETQHSPGVNKIGIAIPSWAALAPHTSLSEPSTELRGVLGMF